MSVERVASVVAVVLSVAALVTSLQSRPAAVERVTPAPLPVVSPQVDAATELEALRLRVRALERRLESGPQAALPPAAPSNGPVPDVAVARPAYVSFSVPSPKLSVEQQGAGFAMHNTDPALTGEVVTVEARLADGGVERLVMVVPAPEAR